MPRVIEVFGDKARVNQVPLGSSINDFMVAQNPELRNFPMPVIAGRTKRECIGVPRSESDVEIVFRRDWGKSLAEDETVVLVAILRPLGGGGGGGGSGGGIFQAVLGVVMIAAAAFMWWNPMGWTAIAGLSASFLGGMAITGGVLLLGGVMGMIGQQPVNMKLNSGINNETASPTYSINGSTNQARLLQPIPEGFGTIQIVPDLVANAYTTYEGNDQFMYVVYGCGRGEYEIDSLYFGDDVFYQDGKIVTSSSLIANPGDVEVQIVQPGKAVTLFPDNVESNSNVSQIQLFHSAHEDYTGWMGPYSSPPAGTTAEKFQMDFLFPRGIGWYNNNGGIDRHTITVGIRVQQIDDNDNPIGTVQELADFNTGWMNTLTPQRISHFVELPKGRYNFEFVNKNTSGSGGTESKPIDDCYIDGLRAYLPGTLKYNQTCIAIKVKATNNLSNSASQEFKCLYTRKLPIWNPTTRRWSAPQATRRFDAAIAAMLKADWGGQLTDDRIDLDALYYCQQKCDEHGWNFDALIDSAYSVMELVTQACQPYRVFPRLIGDKISFMFDEANRPVRHVFTPREITRNSLQPSWAVHTQLTPDYFIVSYLDEDVGYARREVDCILPDSKAQNPKYLQYPIGICSRQLAHDYGIYTAACNRYRRIKMEFSTESLGRILYRGDIISIQHPRLHTLGFGRVMDWNEQQLRVYVDNENCDFDPTTKMMLWAVFNKPDGSIWGPVKLGKYFNGYMVFSKGDYEIVKGQQGNPFSWFLNGYAENPTTFALQTGNKVDRRFIVQDIQYQDLNHATITAMNDDQRVYNQVVPVPAWGYRNTNSSWSGLAAPVTIDVVLDKIGWQCRILWASVLGADTYTLQYYAVYTNEDGELLADITRNNIPNIVRTSIDIPFDNFLENVTYAFCVRAVNDTGAGYYSKTVYIVVRPRIIDEEEDE